MNINCIVCKKELKRKKGEVNLCSNCGKLTLREFLELKLGDLKK